jgi:hypothetical protein
VGIDTLNRIDTGGSSESDSLAEEEKKKFSGDERRDERKKNVLHWVFISFTISLALLGSFVIWSRVLHFVLPENICWLSEKRLQAIDQLFFEGTLGGVLVKFLEACFRQEKGTKD